MGRILVLTALLLAGCASADVSPTEPRVAYVGAMVWDGEAFRARDLVVEGGRIVNAPARTAVQRIELNGGYVVPPFCEAHNHNLGRPQANDETIARYLHEGIFYVGVLSNLPAISDPVRHTYNTPASVDAVFANGPLTASGGHPIRQAPAPSALNPKEYLRDHDAFHLALPNALPTQNGRSRGRIVPWRALTLSPGFFR